MKKIEKIVDINTGEETITERDFTAAEIAEIEKAQAENEAKAQAEAEAAAKKAAAQAKLAALGLTADDLKALGL